MQIVCQNNHNDKKSRLWWQWFQITGFFSTLSISSQSSSQSSELLKWSCKPWERLLPTYVVAKIVRNLVRPVPSHFYIACSKSIALLFRFRFSTCLADLQRNPKGQCVAISSASRADKKWSMVGWLVQYICYILKSETSIVLFHVQHYFSSFSLRPKDY